MPPGLIDFFKRNINSPVGRSAFSALGAFPIGRGITLAPSLLKAGAKFLGRLGSRTRTATIKPPRSFGRGQRTVPPSQGGVRPPGTGRIPTVRPPARPVAPRLGPTSPARLIQTGLAGGISLGAGSILDTGQPRNAVPSSFEDGRARTGGARTPREGGRGEGGGGGDERIGSPSRIQFGPVGRQLTDEFGNELSVGGVPGSVAGVMPSARRGQVGTTSGGSAFTGLLGGVGGLSTPSTAFADEDETALRERGVAGQGERRLTPIQELLFGPLRFTQGARGNLQTPPVDQGASADEVETIFRETTGVTDTAQAFSTDDQAEQFATAVQRWIDERRQLEATQPTPAEPIVDTPEQALAIQEGGSPVQQALDDFRRQNTNLIELQSERQDILKDIQALRAAWAPLFEDIKQNPDLPKGLAQRRLQQMQEQQKAQLEGFLNQLELVNTSISDQNQIVNRAFNIVEFQADEEERQRKNQREAFELLIDTGAIGGLSDAEIQQWANAMGISTRAISQLREDANSPDVKYTLDQLPGGGLREIAVSSKTGEFIASRTIIPSQRDVDVQEDNILNPVDVSRINELHPNAGVNFGDTEEEALAKVAQVTGPISDTELQASIEIAQSSGVDFATAVQQINIDPRVPNKDKAIEKAREIYGMNDTDGGGMVGWFKTLFR